MKRAIPLLAAVLVSPGAPSAGASNQPLPSERALQRVERAASPVRVDGVLDELAWEKAWRMDLAWEVYPGENVPAPVRTEVLAAYDDTAVYFAFRAFDPEPRAIRAHLSDRDNVGNDDWVAVVLDTFNDERRAFALKVNPMGVQEDFIDLATSEGVWDAIWDSEARITDWGWVAEMRIPFSSLRFQRTQGPQTWGLDVVRAYPRDRRSVIGLFPRDRSNNCYFCQAVKIVGFEGVRPGKNLELDPTVTGTRTDSEPEVSGGLRRRGELESDAGVTARWGVTPNLTLAGTVNPDFSQVEADALQLDVNEPFALEFPEKRPFFMEGADFFRTPLSAVYTRSIRDPAWGGKLSGKENGSTVGAFVVRDDATNVLVPGPQFSRGASLDSPSTAAVARYKRDLGSRFTLGGLATSRESDGYHNRVAGFDLSLRFSDTDRLDVQVLGSATRYPGELADALGQPRGELRDWAAEATFQHVTRTFEYWFFGRDIGSEFRADLGFIPRVDLRLAEVGTSRTWIPDGRTWYTNINLAGWARDASDHDGSLLYREANAQLSYEGPLQTHALGRLTRREEAYAGKRFERNELFLHNCMSPRGGTNYWINVTLGDQVDYANAELGSRVRVAPGVSQRVGAHLLVDLSGTWERMRERGEQLYTATIAETTVAYQFTSRSFLRAKVQYVDHDPNAEMFAEGRGERDRNLFTQVLYSYKLNPQTVVFLGYSDASLGDGAGSLSRVSRTVFAKVGYAWVL